MIDEIGGDQLFNTFTRPHKVLMVDFSPGLFKTINEGSLIICDSTLLEELHLNVTSAVEDGSFHRCSLIILLDEDTLGSDVLHKDMNLHMRSLWTSTSVWLKPWNGGLPRCKNSQAFTTAVGNIAAKIDQALKRQSGIKYHTW